MENSMLVYSPCTIKQPGKKRRMTPGSNDPNLLFTMLIFKPSGDF